MSSIYRKGRDGYFYYQTYVVNHKSGKKDKRIFHSLGTKDRNVAEQKQKQLDLKYDKEVYESVVKKISAYCINNPKRVLGISLIIILLTYFNLNDEKKRIDNDLVIEKQKTSLIKNSYKNKTINDSLNNLKKLKNDTIINLKMSLDKQVIEDEIVKIPTYDIIRIEKISNPFNQGKLFVTADSMANEKSLHYLCKILRDKYRNFEYIDIFIYSSDNNGYEMANGNDMSISSEKKKKSWLAMFSYNPVEGEIFNGNPGGYLGAY
ncbi:MAG: hypothetical protein CMG60_00860 [Candidatus Marinimicrobia bacterium]|nr:hypothetical protein [Candidatus Neomarinimicrobiota bacterium]|tara:strand:+ start:9995 stop:10783 length:789 start_codon:yes stop_codon:yes gene_type:complete